MVFYTGLLRLLESEDEIAAILGHEAAHVVSRHIVSTPHTNASRVCIGYYTSELHAKTAHLLLREQQLWARKTPMSLCIAWGTLCTRSFFVKGWQCSAT